MKVGIYAGTIPSTSFIDRLIIGLSNQENIELYIYGRKTESSFTYNKKVHLNGFSSNLNLIIKGLFYRTLFIFQPSLWKEFIGSQSSEIPSDLKKRLKFFGKKLPVVHHRLDVFHIQWAKDLHNWVFLEELGTRVICSLRGAHINYSPLGDIELAKSYERTFPLCSGFHGVSKAIIQEASKYGDMTDKSRVVYSGLNLSDFNFNKKIRSLKKPLEIISIGRSHWVKGYMYSLDACSLLLQMGFEFKYTIVGGKSEEIEFQVNQLNLDNHVMLLNSIAFSEVVEKIKEADVLLLPSVEEGIANVVLESMALGTPVISAKCGGMEEVISHKKNGFLVQTRSPVDLCKKIIEFKNTDEYIIEQIKINARKFVEDNHSESQMVNDMASLYKSVLSSV